MKLVPALKIWPVGAPGSVPVSAGTFGSTGLIAPVASYTGVLPPWFDETQNTSAVGLMAMPQALSTRSG
jgi:hypothetical protein